VRRRTTLFLLLSLLPALAAVTAGLRAQHQPGSATGAPTANPAQAAQPATGEERAPAALSPRNASYLIDVRLDADRRTLTGREVLTWRNISSRPASELRFHLYYNAWKNTRSTWLREEALESRGRPIDASPSPQLWGWIDVGAIRLVGFGSSPPVDLTARRRFLQPDDGNVDDQTVLEVPLPSPVDSGQTINVEIEWTAQIPTIFVRTGSIDRYFFLAQWFPKIGVLEDSGWNCHQFHASTEFFADYGIYDVKMTVPKGWVVGATGVERERHENGETTTYRYYQEDVHDFAWTTSPHYVERRATFTHPTLPAVDMRLLLQPEHVSQAERHFAATRACLRYYGEWFGAYPYPHITIIDPAWQSGAGGMEYPTLFTAGTSWLAPEGVTQPEGVTIHECGHQFWYAIVGNNEFENAWMDEGLNTFSTGRTIDQAYKPNFLDWWYFGDFIPYVLRDVARDEGDGFSGYQEVTRWDVPAIPSYRYWPASAFGVSYGKTALWLNTLERHLGWPVLRKILSTYFERWKFRHPKPEDFFAVVNEVSGRDMTWFFDQVYRSSNVFDYGVEELTSEPAAGLGFFDRNGKKEYVGAPPEGKGAYRTAVIVWRYGEAIFPVEVLVTFENGEKVRERWDGRDRWHAFTYERASRVRSAEVDANHVLLLDINRTNNSRTLAPMADQASRKWMFKWLVWFQDLLMTYAFFV
jgi:hypothetical protein